MSSTSKRSRRSSMNPIISSAAEPLRVRRARSFADLVCLVQRGVLVSASSSAELGSSSADLLERGAAPIEDILE